MNKRTRQYKLKKKLEKDPDYPIQRIKDLMSIVTGVTYHQQPGSYVTKEQEEMVHIFMTNILNWKYNEKTKRFYKEGVKDADNNWYIIKPKKKKPEPKRQYYTEEQKKEIAPKVVELRKTMSWKQIEDVFGINDTTLYVWYEEYRKAH